MTISTHVSALENKKTQLEADIAYEMKRPMPDFLKLSELKRAKLVIKQQITDFLSLRKAVPA